MVNKYDLEKINYNQVNNFFVSVSKFCAGLFCSGGICPGGYMS